MTTASSVAVAFLRQHLSRVEPVAEKTIAPLVLDLDSSEFAVREHASEELAKLGHLAEPALRKALTRQPSLEVCRRSRCWNTLDLPKLGGCWSISAEAPRRHA